MRAHLLTLSFALALGGCAGSSEPTETVPPSVLTGETEEAGVFADCTARQLGGAGVEVDCASFALEVERSRESSFEEVLDTYVQSRIFGGGGEQTETAVQSYSLAVGGNRYPGRKFRRKSEVMPRSAEIGFVVVAENPDGVTIALACTSREVKDRKVDLEGQCRKAMLQVVRYGLPTRFRQKKK